MKNGRQDRIAETLTQPMEKYFPSSFLTSKHIRQEQTDPISTNRKLQAATSCTSILYQPDEYPNSSVSIRPRACFSPSYNKVKSQTKHVWLLTLL